VDVFEQTNGDQSHIRCNTIVTKVFPMWCDS